MSLVINEIVMVDGFKHTFIVCAADRMLTNPDGSFNAVKPKLLRIPYLNAAISYFGLAQVFPQNRAVYICDWLQDFINKQAGVSDLNEFSHSLKEALHCVVHPQTLRVNPSGFHICGYNSDGLPDFWYLSNIGGMKKFEHTDIRTRYTEPASHFLGRDAKKLGWNGTDRSFVKNKVQIYRNGDYRAHVVAWDALSKILDAMQSFPDFKKLCAPEDYEDRIRFKLGVIAHIYKKFCRRPTVGGGIDAFTLQKPKTPEPAANNN
jgi:hypothetical protein